MSEPMRRSALHGREAIAGPGGDRMVERAFLGKLVLRADPAVADDLVSPILGAALPANLRSSVAGDTAALWIGPDEFWIVTPPGDERPLAGRLDAALAGLAHQVADVSDYYTAIELAGPHAREILMKLSTLDLHPRAFAAGHVAGTMLARAQATLWLADGEEPSFRVFVRWSMADYLWCLMAECGREFGLPPQVPVAGETWRLAR